MINREDLAFATCYQIAQLISSDWDNIQLEEVKDAIEALTPIDEPGEVFNGVPIHGTNALKLTPSEKEPESIRIGRRIIELKIVSNIFKVIMKNSDGWETADSDIIKKEILSRISNYEDEAKKLIEPMPFNCDIVV